MEELRAVLGPRGVLTEPEDMAPYCTDWTGTLTGRAAAVLRPRSTAEVAACLRWAQATGTAVVPQGGNTGLAGGATPSATGEQAVLSLERLRAVREVAPEAGTITVEAGVVLADVQRAAAEAGRLFPLSLASEGSCSVGGVVSTNAGGTAVLRYGMTRDLVLGLEVVLPDGRVWDGLRPLRKDNTGYDLKQLFVGAEGTLGVVTAAVLRLLPATPRRATALVALPDVAAAVAVLGVLQEYAAGSLTTWELVSREALALVLARGARDPFARPHGWYGLVELAGQAGDDLDAALESALASAVDRGLVDDAVVAAARTQRAELWALREGISEAHQRVGGGPKHDVSLPLGTLADFTSATADRLAAVLPGVRLVVYGHVGDGNLHYNLAAPPGREEAFRETGERLTAAVYDEVAARGGSISAEHGLGTLKRAAAAAYKSDVELDLMRSLKAALDPRGLLNPGKVL